MVREGGRERNAREREREGEREERGYESGEISSDVKDFEMGSFPYLLPTESASDGTERPRL